MKRVITAIVFALLFLPQVVLSQDTVPTVRLKFDTRFDFTAKVPMQDSLSTLSSFDGKYLNIILDGEINDKFSYNYRQRMILDSKPTYQSFFNATDYLYLTYKINRNFSVAGGKQIVAIGGFEYDEAPIDIYFWSNFWNNVTCYQIGGSLNYKTSDDKHTIGFQIVNSPFTTESLQGIYAYNLIWHGNFDGFNTIYSLNRIEVEKAEYINYITLGNKFSINKLSVEVDLMDRFSDNQTNLFSDYSIIGKFKYSLNNKLSLHVKAGYDQNKSQEPTDLFIYDRYVIPGTEHAFYGAGVEYYPINDSRDLRIHAVWTSNNNTLQYQTFNIGVRWQMNISKKKVTQ
ncbi:MAG: porin [Salinivirgaceae bacterium]|nr:porin [Salinivirgaceae bacterium]MDD4746309.1 porin [Salinivirgaceae bacterium]